MGEGGGVETKQVVVGRAAEQSVHDEEQMLLTAHCNPGSGSTFANPEIPELEKNDQGCIPYLGLRFSCQYQK